MFEAAIKYMVMTMGSSMMQPTVVVCYDQPSDYFVMFYVEKNEDKNFQLANHVRRQYPGEALQFYDADEFVLDTSNDSGWVISGPVSATIKPPEDRSGTFSISIDHEGAPSAIECRIEK